MLVCSFHLSLYQALTYKRVFIFYVFGGSDPLEHDASSSLYFQANLQPVAEVAHLESVPYSISGYASSELVTYPMGAEMNPLHTLPCPLLATTHIYLITKLNVHRF